MLALFVRTCVIYSCDVNLGVLIGWRLPHNSSSKFISVTFIATFVRFVTTSLVCDNKNNGDKLHSRKSMWAADEKLIINELGPTWVSDV